MLELFFELGMLPFWVVVGGVCLCLVGAWFRKSRRAAGIALTLIWVAGFFYVPLFLWHYGRYHQALEALQHGEALDAREAQQFREITRCAWTYGALLTIASATYVLLQPRRPATKRKSQLEVEYLKAVEAKRAKAEAEKKPPEEGVEPPAEEASS